jgi:hypothetical protein
MSSESQKLSLEQLEELLFQKCAAVKDESPKAQTAIEIFLLQRSQRLPANELLVTLRNLCGSNQRIRAAQEDITHLMGLCIEAQEARVDKRLSELQKAVDAAQEEKRAYLPRLNRELRETQNSANIPAAQIMRLRSSGKIVNLGYDHYTTKQEKEDPSYREPVNHLFKEDQEPFLRELRKHFAAEKKSMKAVYVPGIIPADLDPTPEQNRAVPWINVILQPQKFEGPDIEDWDISDLIAICQYYGWEELPPTLRNYVFLTDAKAWNPYQLVRPAVALSNAATNAERAKAVFKEPEEPKPAQEAPAEAEANHKSSTSASSVVGRGKK